jgi:hypothetical protein
MTQIYSPFINFSRRLAPFIIGLILFVSCVFWPDRSRAQSSEWTRSYRGRLGDSALAIELFTDSTDPIVVGKSIFNLTVVGRASYLAFGRFQNKNQFTFSILGRRGKILESIKGQLSPKLDTLNAVITWYHPYRLARVTLLYDTITLRSMAIDLANRLKKAVLANRRSEVVSLIGLPIDINLHGRKTRIIDSSTFIRRYSEIFTPGFLKQIEQNHPEDIWLHNGEYSFGEHGEIWIATFGANGIYRTVVTSLGPLQ